MGLFDSIGHALGYNSGADDVLDDVMKMFGSLQKGQTQRYDQAQNYMAQIVPLLQKGFGDARAEAQRAGGQTRREIADQAKAAQGRSTSNLVSRGLYNSSRATSESTGIGMARDRAISGANADMARILGGLDVGQAQALSGAQAKMADFLTGRSGAETALGLERLGTFAQAPRDSSSGWAWDLLNAGLSIAAI